MKNRKGFVSNSSSCSFVITWKDKLVADDLDQSLIRLFDMYENESLEESDLSCLKKNTKYIDDGQYQTNLITSMYNDFRDTPYLIQLLVSALIINQVKGFELIHSVSKEV